MTKHELRNALCILRSIDRHELLEAGLELTDVRWTKFAANPYEWFVRASDSDTDKVWTVIEARSRPGEART